MCKNDTEMLQRLLWVVKKTDRTFFDKLLISADVYQEAMEHPMFSCMDIPSSKFRKSKAKGCVLFLLQGTVVKAADIKSPEGSYIRLWDAINTEKTS